MVLQSGLPGPTKPEPTLVNTDNEMPILSASPLLAMNTTGHTSRSVLTSHRLWYVSNSARSQTPTAFLIGTLAVASASHTRDASEHAARSPRSQSPRASQSLTRVKPEARQLLRCKCPPPKPTPPAIHLNIRKSPVSHSHRSLPSKPGSVYSRLLGSDLPVVISKA